MVLLTPKTTVFVAGAVWRVQHNRQDPGNIGSDPLGGWTWIAECLAALWLRQSPRDPPVGDETQLRLCASDQYPTGASKRG